MGRNCSCDNNDESETGSHRERERVCFPARKPISKLVNDEVIISLISSVSED